MADINKLDVSFADTEALGAWLEKLAADIIAGKVVGFDIATTRKPGKVIGKLVFPLPTNLTVELADPESEEE